MIAGIGVGVVIITKDQAADSSAGIGPSVLPSGIPSLTTKDVGPDAQQWLESTNGPLLNGSDGGEGLCPGCFASGRPNPQVRLVQPAKVDGKRAVLIGLQGGSPRDIQIFAVTGCSDGGAAIPVLRHNITLATAETPVHRPGPAWPLCAHPTAPSGEWSASRIR